MKGHHESNKTYLKLWRKGYDNLRMGEGLDLEESTLKSVMEVIHNELTTELHVVAVTSGESADLEYYASNGDIVPFSLSEGGSVEFEDFTLIIEKIGYNDVCMAFHAPRDVRFRRADAREWKE